MIIWIVNSLPFLTVIVFVNDTCHAVYGINLFCMRFWDKNLLTEAHSDEWSLPQTILSSLIIALTHKSPLIRTGRQLNLGVCFGLNPLIGLSNS